MRLTRPSHGTVVAYLALVVAMSGSAYAATGGDFLLGKSNKAGATSSLTNTGNGPALALHNDTGAPLSVGGNDTKVQDLNADQLDGASLNTLQRRVIGQCPRGSAMKHIRPDGGVGCSSQTMWAYVASDGTLGAHSAGILSSSQAASASPYVIHTSRNVTSCASFATLGYNFPAKFQVGFVEITGGSSNQNLLVWPYNSSVNSMDSGFSVLILC